MLLTRVYHAPLPVLLLIVHVILGQCRSSITVHPSTVPAEIPTVLTITGSDFINNGSSSICSITADADNTFVGYKYGGIAPVHC